MPARKFLNLCDNNTRPNIKGTLVKSLLGIVSLCFLFQSASAFSVETSGKLLLTGGVSQLEGSAGGGITPWALIGGYGTRDQIGANAYYTNVAMSDYKLESFGALIGIMDRVELSVARQTLDTQKVGSLLGLNHNFKIQQNILGVKVKLVGDAVLEQDSWLPQISVGAQHKKNQQGTIVKSLGAEDDTGIDYYVSATKVFLSQSLLANITLRRTEANQLGLLGFGGDKNEHHKLYPEASLAYLLCQNFALGAEYRSKPDNLRVAEEDDWWDVFAAWAPTKNISLTLAYATLGRVAIKDNQSAVYSSLQIGF